MQKNGRNLARGFMWVSMLFLLCTPNVTPQISDRDKTEMDIKSELDMKARLEKQRQQDEFDKLKQRAAKLHQLTGELQEMIDQSSPHVVSIPINKKTAEIEKILKEIKSRTKF